MALKFAAGLPTVGEFGDVRKLVGLAVAAERHGWDGVHLWDHLLFDDPAWPVTNSVVTAAAVAAATERVRIVLTVVLPRRQVQDVAQESAAIDALSGGRLTLLPIIGSVDREFTDFGIDADPRSRGRALDERLARLTELWEQWDVPRIPIWCGGLWPNRAGLRRAARFDGAMPIFGRQRERNVPPGEFGEAADFVRRQRAAEPSDPVPEGATTAAEPSDPVPEGATTAAEPSDSVLEGVAEPFDLVLEGVAEPFDLVLEGATTAATAAEQTRPYAEAGLTWWVEAFGWWRGGVAAAAERISDGPAAA